MGLNHARQLLELVRQQRAKKIDAINAAFSEGIEKAESEHVVAKNKLETDISKALSITARKHGCLSSCNPDVYFTSSSKSNDSDTRFTIHVPTHPRLKKTLQKLNDMKNRRDREQKEARDRADSIITRLTVRGATPANITAIEAFIGAK